MASKETIYLPTQTLDDHYFKVNVLGDKPFSNKFDYNLFSIGTSNELSYMKLLVNQVFPQLNLPKSKEELRKKALNNILTNLINSNSNGKYLAISKNGNDYSHSSFYGVEHYTYAYIVEPINKLIKNGFIEQFIGYNSRNGGKSFRTRISPTEKLLDLAAEIFANNFEEKPIPFTNTTMNKNMYISSNTNDFEWYSNPLFLNKKIDGVKYPMRYKKDNSVREKIAFLNKYNRMIRKCQISIPTIKNHILNNTYKTLHINNTYNQTHTTTLLIGVSGLFFEHTRLNGYLYRVFNDGVFSKGGRFYNRGYQKFNDEIRRHIRINGFPTVEIDYSAFHLNMLYHMKGIDYKGDPYSDVIEEDLRSLLKKVALISINEAHRGRAYRAFEDEINSDNELYHLFENSGYKTKDLFAMFEIKHYQIKDSFHTGIGKDLQYKDSCITEAILRHFTNQKIVCLPVHDSYIVETKYKDELEALMRKVYKEFIGFECKLKIN